MKEIKAEYTGILPAFFHVITNPMQVESIIFKLLSTKVEKKSLEWWFIS